MSKDQSTPAPRALRRSANALRAAIHMLATLSRGPDVQDIGEEYNRVAQWLDERADAEEERRAR